MPEINPNHAPAPRAGLAWDGTDYRVPASDVDGHLQVDALSTALAPDAATATNQATEIASLQLIDDLRDALQSVAVDRLRVTGADQLISYKGSVLAKRLAAISGVGGYLETAAVTAGEVWKVTNLMARDRTTSTTIHTYQVFRGATYYMIGEARGSFAALTPTFWRGEVWLDAGDTVRVFFTGGAAGDSCEIDLAGYRMTKV